MLVRHSAPEIVADRPARSWALSAEGRARCEALAEALRPHEPDLFVASREPKAQETARLTAVLLHRPVETAEGLHEHERDNAGFLGPGEFRARLEALFSEPDRLVFGSETARQAEERFSAAVGALVRDHPKGNIAVVAHGTVIALFVARAAGLDAFELWRRLDVPSFVVLGLPAMEPIEVRESVVR